MPKNIDWTPRVKLLNGQIADYLGRCAISGKHRVATAANKVGPPSGESNEWRFVWLLNDAGICRADGAPGDGHDWSAAA